MRKSNLFFSVLIMLGMCVLEGCTKVNQVEVPAPDFKELIVQTSKFSGYKRHSDDPLRSQENYGVTVISKDGLIFFQENVEVYDASGNLTTELREYEVEFDIPEFKNAGEFTIPQQRSNNVEYKGLSLYEDRDAHGYYTIEDTDGNAINPTLDFKISINGVIWTYSLTAK